MRKTETNITEQLINEEKSIKKCEKGVFKCMGIILFCSFTVGISFYAGFRYNNYLNDNSESI